MKPAAPKPTPVTHPLSSRVHPLNQSSPPRFTWKCQREAAQKAAAAAAKHTPNRRSSGTTASNPATASFQSSPSVLSSLTPHLSALFAKRGLGGDLQAAVTEAKAKVDLGPDEAEDDSTVTSPGGQAAAAPSRTVSGATHLSSERPQSRKGHRQPASRPRPAPLSSMLPSQAVRNAEIPESPQQESDLSPHTADSNPGLVSDHDDEASEAEDETHPEINHPARPLDINPTIPCGGEMEVDVEVEDDHDGHGLLIRRRTMLGREREAMFTGSTSTRPASRYSEGGR